MLITKDELFSAIIQHKWVFRKLFKNKQAKA